jgi:hypothetical protein
MDRNANNPAAVPDPSEDLMRELVALSERVELQGPAVADRIVAGFRRDGRLSIYFGEDCCYQFDPEGRLRRALIDGRLYRTQGNGLAALSRGRNADETVLIRHDLDSAELEQFVGQMVERLRALHDAVSSRSVQVTRQVPTDASVVERLVRSLEVVLSAAGELAPAINRMR